MQTPPAIGKKFLWLSPSIFTIYYFADEIAKSKLEDKVILNKKNSVTIDYLNEDESVNVKNLSLELKGNNDTQKGYVIIKDKKKEMTKLELIDLIEYTKQNIIDKDRLGTYDNNYKQNFRELVNGVFQAEGHIGGYFPSASRITFRPLVYISQNASDSSIEFLSLFWLFLDKKFEFVISQNETSRYFHIRVLSRNWDFIIYKLIPYLSLVYSDKHIGFLKLNDIFNLHKKPNVLKMSKVKVISLAYSLVNSPGEARKNQDISDKISAVLGKAIKTEYSNIIYPDNDKPLSILFVLGFLLGDGNFGIRIRDTKKGLWFIPLIRLEQKCTLNNSNLFNNIVKYLNKLEIDGRIYSAQEKSHNSSHVVLTIDNKTSLSNFIKSIKKHRELFFWKQEQIDIVMKSLIIISVAARHWKQSQISLLQFLYNKSDNNRKFNLNYWIKKLDDLYNERNRSSLREATSSNEFYITISKDRAWAVNLPTALNIKPKTKYFFFKTFNFSKQKALLAAVNYRNAQLNNWLLLNGFTI